jgi:hypothetical protein
LHTTVRHLLDKDIVVVVVSCDARSALWHVNVVLPQLIKLNTHKDVHSLGPRGLGVTGRRRRETVIGRGWCYLQRQAPTRT